MHQQIKPYLVTLFCLAYVVLPATVNANPNKTSHCTNCSDYLPTDAVAERSLYLCESQFNGKNNVYACQDYQSRSGRYRVLFKGGRIPKLISRVTKSGKTQQVVWPGEDVISQPVCYLPVPSQIPEGSTFQGAGVCSNDDDQTVPCAVFRHRSPRHQTFSDHISLYDAEGHGPQQTNLVYKGYNKDAMPAELAYQIGLRLLDTTCCQQRGLEYIKQAYQLFPTSPVYSQAYQQFKSEISTTGSINIVE